MKTRLRIIILTVLIFGLAGSAFTLDRLIDNAGILDASVKASLLDRLNSVSTQYDFDLVIVTENSIGSKSPMDYADDFFDYNGYGLGNDNDGCIFLLVMGSRDYWFSTSGRGIKLMNSTAGDKLEKSVLPYLKNDNFPDAFRAFISDWEEFLILDSRGRSYNFFHHYNLILTAIAWLVSLATGFLIVFSWKAKMNNVVPQHLATAYIIPGSLAFTEKKLFAQPDFLCKIEQRLLADDSGTLLG